MTSTVDQHETAESTRPPSNRGGPRAVLAFGRNVWRGLTSMRTALVLLFLLALGALPGALLPQRTLNPPKVDDYIAAHGWWGRLLNSLQFFNVYSSVWFSAIYVLLFVSLVGCLLPRGFEYVKHIRAQPVLTPRNLRRMPHYAEFTVTDGVSSVTDILAEKLRGWRTLRRAEDGGIRTMSAEKGYLRETGNLIFHFALLGLIVAFALGKMFSYSGTVIVQADGKDDAQFCNSGVLAYDSFTPGLRVDGTQLDPFCVKVLNFTAHYQPDGDADYYDAPIEYQTGANLASNSWQSYDLKVNSPLRTGGDRVYLQGHGYTPIFTVTFPNGQKRTQATQWKPDDQKTLLSEGATKFDAAGVIDPIQQRKKQIAITGLFAPTAVFDNGLMTSAYPSLVSPGVAVDIYQGDLGADAGNSQSIFAIDQKMVDQGLLKKVKRTNMVLGDPKSDTVKLADGTTIQFSGVQQWVSLLVAHDPTQVWVLVFGIAMLVGLACSLIIKRRRFWLRVTPLAADGEEVRTLVRCGGLARTDQAGYGEEFARITAGLRESLTVVDVDVEEAEADSTADDCEDD